MRTCLLAREMLHALSLLLVTTTVVGVGLGPGVLPAAAAAAGTVAGIVAQSATATLSGAVLDESGAAIPDVTIVVRQLATGLQRQTVSSGQGGFVLPLLPPGRYSLTAQREGFMPARVESVTLNVNDDVLLKLQLKVAGVGEAVRVTAEASRVRTSPAVATTIDRQFVENLPLNGRSFQSLILLTPGVVVARADDDNPGQFSVNGQRTNANYFTVDGVSANIGVPLTTDTQHAIASFSQQMAGTVPGLTASGGTNNLISIDALEEYTIQTATYTAEFGRQPGGQIALVTRSGTNQFRGSSYEFLRNEALDANDWFSNANGVPKAPRRQHMFGGTFGGPVLVPGLYDGRDRTFFFASYEGLRLRLPLTGEYRVPSLRIRETAAPVLRPFLNAFPRPTGPELVGADGQPLGYAPLAFSASHPERMDATSLRLDRTAGASLRLFGRYNHAISRQAERHGYNLAAMTEAAGTTRTLTLGATQTLTPRLHHELRVNYSDNRGRSQERLDDYGGAVPMPWSRDALPAGLTGPVTVALQYTLAPGADGNVFLGDGADSRQRQLNIVDTWTWGTGNHAWKFGVDYRRLLPVYGPWTYFEFVDFYGEAALRDGIATTLTQGASQGARLIFNNVSAFVQDTWRLSPRMTLDLGLRWEVNPAPREADGQRPALVSLEDVARVDEARLVGQDESFYRTTWTGFAPRIGGAFVLRDRPGRETVVRAGGSLAYDLGSGQAAQGFSANGPPFSLFVSRENVPYPLSPELAVPPALGPVTLPTTHTLFALNPGLTLPYTLQWSTAVEQALGATQTVTISYVGSAGRRLLATQWLNNERADGSRPNPSFGSILWSSNGPSSDYHALQAQFQRRLSNGFQALVNYTWSHAIDEVSDELSYSSLYRGNASFDVRHNASAALTVSLPTLRAGALAPLFRGWSMDAIAHAQSGMPLDISVDAQILPDGTYYLMRPDRVPGEPLYLDDPTVPGGRRFNLAAFQVPAPGPDGRPTRQGNLGRNVLRDLPLYQVDLALQRQIALSSRWRLRIRAEAFNLLNHPTFTDPWRSMDSPGQFGVPTRTMNSSLGGLNALYQIGGPRSVQLSMKLSF